MTNGKNNPRKYRIPPETLLPPFGFAVFYEYQFNPDFTGDAPSFSMNSAHGDEVFIFTGDATGRLTGLRGGIEFDATENGVSLGRYTDSLGGDYKLTVKVK